MKTPTVKQLKNAFRSALLAYRRTLNPDLDCGLHMQAIIRPQVSIAARRVNRLGRILKKHDPDFPTSWTPYPEG